MAHHDLKILPSFFDAVIAGLKTFEIRNNDRCFEAGDTVALHEYDSDVNKYTGRERRFTIGYVTSYEQKAGYVVFSLV